MDRDLRDALAARPGHERKAVAARSRRPDAPGLCRSHAILSDDRGAPRLPPGWVGSVSHKGAFAAALVGPASDGQAIYKAIDPYLRRHVGFLEAELEFATDDETINVISELPLRIEASCREVAGHWLATARGIDNAAAGGNREAMPRPGDRDAQLGAAMVEREELRRSHLRAVVDLQRIGRLVVREPGHESDFCGQRDAVATRRAQHARVAVEIEKLMGRDGSGDVEGAAQTARDPHEQSRSVSQDLVIISEVEAFWSLRDLAREAALEEGAGRSVVVDPVEERRRLEELAEAWHAETQRLWLLIRPGRRGTLVLP